MKSIRQIFLFRQFEESTKMLFREKAFLNNLLICSSGYNFQNTNNFELHSENLRIYFL